MAKPKQPSNRGADWYKGTNSGTEGGAKKEWVPAQFVRSELTTQEKEHVKSQAYTWEDIEEHLPALVESGYKVSISSDVRTSAVAVWLTPTSEDNPNHGFVLSARGPSVLAALSVAFYKHYTKFDGIWPKDDSQIERDQWA